MDRDPLLQEREKTHGDFKANAKLWMGLCRLANTPPDRLTDEQKLALSMIFLKIARAIERPNNKDHWKDISGYALLAMEACDG